MAYSAKPPLARYMEPFTWFKTQQRCGFKNDTMVEHCVAYSPALNVLAHGINDT
jgi:hypothetical protein